MTTERLAEAVAAVRSADVPAPAREAARLAIMDGIGVALAGSAEEGPRLLRDVVEASTGPSDAATVWGTAARTGALDAALLNGAAAHVLDLDDLNRSLRGHPTAPLIPALLALAEERRLPGRDVVEAYVVGFEVECKLGDVMNLEHFERGWHSSSTLGTLGAAAGAGRLLALDAGRMASCLAIAASMSSGLVRNFGAMTKAFHIGHAARCGLLAARLAERGFTGSRTVLEAEDGFVQIFSGRPGAALADVVDRFGRPWDVVDPGIAFKLYPSCSLTHPPLDAALALVERHGVRADQIERIDCHGNYRVPMVLTYPVPETGLQGKFSLPYSLAVAFCDGRVGIEQFDDARVRRADVQTLLRRVAFHVHPELRSRESVDRDFCIVQVELKGGGRVEARVGAPRGTPQNPLSAAALADKFTACAARVLPGPRVDAILARLERIEDEPDVRTLMSLLAGI